MRWKSCIWIVVLFVVLLMPEKALGRWMDTLKVQDDQSLLNITPHMAYTFFEQEKGVSLSLALEALDQGDFQKIVKSRFKFGYRKQELWLHTLMHNPGDAGTYSLRLDVGILRQVSLFVLDADRNVVLHHDSYAGLPKPEWLVSLDAGQVYHVLLQIRPQGKLTESAVLLEQVDSRLFKEERFGWVMGMVYGVFLFVALWNLFYFFTLGNAAYLYYSGYAFFIFWIWMYLDGYAYMLPIPEHIHDHVAIYCQRFAIACTFYCAVKLVRYKFETNVFSRLIQGYFIYDLILTPLVQLFLEPHQLVIFYVLVPINATFVSVMILLVIRRGEPNLRRLIRYYWMAYIVLGLGILLTQLQIMGILHFPFPTNFPPKLAIALDVVITSFAVGQGIKLIQEQHLLKEQELMQLQSEFDTVKHRNLQLQLSPHFFFNSLNAIRNLVLEKETEIADEQLMKFSTMARSMLEHARSPLIPLEKECYFLENYMALQQVRFSDGFEAWVEVGEGLQTDQVQLPPMLIQPFVENAIEHGKLHQQKNGYVRVKFWRENNALHVKIEDNGIGIEKSRSAKLDQESQHKSLGIELIRERLSKTFGLGDIPFDADVSLRDRNEIGKQGTEVFLILPFIERH